MENLLPAYFWVWTIHKYRKYTSRILLSLKIDYLESKYLKYISGFEKNASIQKVYFKYTSDPETKYKCILKTLSKYTWSIIITKFLMDSWYILDILETYRFKLFFSDTNFGNQNISKSVLEVYVIFRVQKYIWSIAQFQQGKILTKV